VVYAKEFFDLQLTFAEAVCSATGMPRERCLFEYTNLYVRFGLGREFDADHPAWRSYLAGLRGAEDARAWTYRFYLDDPEVRTAPPVVATFGCFSYARSGSGPVRLHFRNAETDGVSPLAADRAGQRRAELAALFRQIRKTVGDSVQVAGVSWLYNIEAYRRLFPPAYVASAEVVRDKFRSMPLWGQFVDRHGAVKDAMARPFLAAIQGRNNLRDPNMCFPYPVQTVHAHAREFHDFYAV